MVRNGPTKLIDRFSMGTIGNSSNFVLVKHHRCGFEEEMLEQEKMLGYIVPIGVVSELHWTSSSVFLLSFQQRGNHPMDIGRKTKAINVNDFLFE